MNEALHIKYRPQRFEDVVGQDRVIKVLEKSFLKDKIHPAILFTGNPGLGKTTLARLIAKRLHCDNAFNIDEKTQGEYPVFESCNICDSCLAVNKGNHPDVIELDAAGNSGVDNMRELVTSTMYLPSMSQYTVIIINEVQRLSKEAYDTLLAPMEKQDSHVVWILTTTEPNKVPEAIKSRCLPLRLNSLDKKDMSLYINNISDEEGIKINKNTLTEMINVSLGSPRLALQYLDLIDKSGIKKKGEVYEMSGAISTASMDTFFETLNDVEKPDNEIMRMARNISKKGNIQETMEGMIEWILKNVTVIHTKNNLIVIIGQYINNIHHWKDEQLCFGAMVVHLLATRQRKSPDLNEQLKDFMKFEK